MRKDSWKKSKTLIRGNNEDLLEDIQTSTKHIPEEIDLIGKNQQNLSHLLKITTGNLYHFLITRTLLEADRFLR